MTGRSRISLAASALGWTMLAAGIGWAGWMMVRPVPSLDEAAALATAGDYDAAEARVEVLLKARPASSPGHLLAAQVLLDRPPPEGDDADRLLLDRADRAAGHLDRVRPEGGATAAIVALYRGKADYYRKRMAQAEAHWLEALRLDPQVPEAGWSLLDLYYLQGRDGEGRDLALRLHGVEPDRHDRVQLLLELVRQDAMPLAPGAVVERFRPVVERHPDDLHSAIALGLGLVRDSKAPEGLELLRREVERRPENPDAWDALLTGLDDAGEVALMARTIEQLPPGLADSPGFARHFGRIAQERGDWAASAEAYRRAVADDPEDTRLRYRLGRALRNAGDVEGADRLDARLARSEAASKEVRDLYDRANAEENLGDPALVPLYRTIADQRERLGRPREALAWHRLVLEARPDDPEGLAAVARLRGQVDGAETIDETIQDEPPSS
ncbi:tetratricopeptide repeat protein [Tautonia plasticadhaerens]|uniref:Cellulose synthase subunit BcsC n=1 Tax=Tautonia plasticadhaerens TaxID=2527974 RepID=A0A518H0I5_9BACT|nr:tetratricopeptide repeat protein [Tautonia plasticadhaerens]QDV34352.1 cellulose synthase subunit BcsC [Tautonia plasticadhaerens]